MELWIRNQNRETLELTTYLQIIYMYELDTENKWVIEGGSYLGYYKTKERALEVLDEIQSILDFNDIRGIVVNANRINSYVYEMPEE